MPLDRVRATSKCVSCATAVRVRAHQAHLQLAQLHDKARSSAIALERGGYLQGHELIAVVDLLVRPHDGSARQQSLVRLVPKVDLFRAQGDRGRRITRHSITGQARHEAREAAVCNVWATTREARQG